MNPASECCPATAAAVPSSLAGFFGHLFDTSSYPARWHCGSWSGLEGWLHIVSDLGIFSAYFAIPCAIVYFVCKRRDIPFNGVFFLFATFILLCGTGHLLEAVIFYYPIYRIAGLLKLATAVVSWATFFALLKLLPKACDLPRLATINEKLRHADASKSSFLANMSHEIRTPLTAILGFADSLVDDSTEEERQTAIATIRRNGQHLLAVINDILDLSKIEAGQLTLELVSCNPAEVLESAIALLQIKADAKSLPLLVTVDQRTPASIKTDPTRLRQVLFNIVDNAIKFTPHGSVQVRLSVAEAAQGHELRFSVIDTGVGVAEEQKSRLFRPFSQGDSSITRTHGGTGLGLVICRRLMQALGGTIRLEANPEQQGSKFVVTLPCTLTEATQQDAKSPASETQVVTPTRLALDAHVLLVEDGPDNQRLFGMILRKAGATVDVAENGQLALEAIAANQQDPAAAPFDLILMDMQMPVLDGYSATRALRERGYHGPIIALTAHAMQGDRERCLDAGCDGYLTKPTTRETFIATVAQFVSEFRSAKQAPETGDAFEQMVLATVSGE